jgi:hypothetical protein
MHGAIESRGKRKNHAEDNIQSILAVPRYADALEYAEESDEGETETSQSAQSPLVTSARSWRQVIGGWVEKERESAEDSEVDEQVNTTDTARRSKQWLARSLELLFGGQAK